MAVWLLYSINYLLAFDMVKFLSIITLALGLLCFTLFQMCINRGRQIDLLEAQKKALNGNINYLEAEIEKRNQKELDVDIRIRELEEAAEKAAALGGFDWNRDISSDPVVIQLKERGR